MMILNIHNLHATVNGENILNGLDLQVQKGTVHAIMGPNGAGKSTLCNVLAGHPNYVVTQGTVTLNNTDLLTLSIEQRAATGLFIGFQYPVELPGVHINNFLMTALNAQRIYNNLPPLNAHDFLNYMKEKQQLVNMDPKLINRNVNEGFSGGEKKRNEILQMAVLQPKLAILDETDSGLDIDALQIVADGVNKLKSKDNAIILITHYQRLLNYITPDVVHVMVNGRIVQSAGPELAMQLETQGYQQFIDN